LQIAEALLEHADHRLRIVAPRDRRQHFLADDEDLRAARLGFRGDILDRLHAARRLGEDQRSNRPALVERVDDELQALGDEQLLLVARFLHVQRADRLHFRIGKAGDFLHAAHDCATQRENSEVERARPADFSRMTSSPDSTIPPSPMKVSSINSCMAKNDARIE
jgi:hypothetical protein